MISPMKTIITQRITFLELLNEVVNPKSIEKQVERSYRWRHVSWKCGQRDAWINRSMVSFRIHAVQKWISRAFDLAR